jgi:hypothetical protein
MRAVVSVVVTAALLFSAATAAARTISFSGFTWNVKTSHGGLAGPGPNFFSDSSNNVFVDSNGDLHLKITFDNGMWNCAEVILDRSLGYGRYLFKLDSRVDDLDPQAVLGLFTYSDSPLFNNREIDIEFSRFANASDPDNAQYVVQPYTIPGNLFRWRMPAVSPSRHSFHWTPKQVLFESFADHDRIARFRNDGPTVPPKGDEKVHLNLWLFRGMAPQRGHTVEVIIKAFHFRAADQH